MTKEHYRITMTIIEQSDPQHIFNWQTKQESPNSPEVIEIRNGDTKFGYFTFKDATVHVAIGTHLCSFELSDPKSIEQISNYILRCIVYRLVAEIDKKDDPEISTPPVSTLQVVTLRFLDVAMTAIIIAGILYAIYMFKQ